MHFTILDVSVLLGLVLSLFLVLLLWTSRSFRSDVHHFFALTLIALNLSLAVIWLEAYVPASGVLELINWPFLFPFAFLMYVLRAIKDPLSYSPWAWLFLAPCLILSAFQMADFCTGFDVYEWLSGGEEARYLFLIELVSFSFVPYAIALVGFSYWKIRQAQGISRQEKNWLAFNSLSILFFCVTWLFSDLLAALFDVAIWKYLLAFLGIFLAITTYLGVHRLNIFEQRRLLKEVQGSEVKNTTAPPVRSDPEKPSKKMLAKAEQLRTLMVEDQLYQNPALTRSTVADHLDLSEGYLSELVRTMFDANFNDFVNEFRVQRAIELFENEKFALFSIEAIGYECGFNSKSVFYKAFKKVTKKTPGAYRKALNLS